MDRPGGVLLDLDGTIYEADRVVPGAPEAVARLRRAGLAVAFCTNTTRMPPRALGARLAALGIPAVPGEIVTAPAAAAAWLRAEGIRRVALYVAEATLEEFPDCTLDAAAPEAVVLGDLAAGWTFAVLNRAFRQVLGGPRVCGRSWCAAGGIGSGTRPRSRPRPTPSWTRWRGCRHCSAWSSGVSPRDADRGSGGLRVPARGRFGTPRAR